MLVNRNGVQNAQPFLLDKSVPQDPVAVELIEEYRPLMANYTSTVGITVSKLRQSGLFEGNLGNAITDSMVQEGQWSDATIGFMNNGGIR